MSTADLVRPLTVRTLLFDTDRHIGTGEVIGRAMTKQDAAASALRGVHHLTTAAVHSVDREIGTMVDNLLEIDLGDVLISCWRKHRALTAAARASLANPSSEEVVSLASHKATATYSPDVDLLVDGKKLRTFEFTLSLVLEATGLAAVVKAGDLVGLHGGDCVATATLSFEGEQLAKRQAHLDPAALVRLDPGIPLIDKGTGAQVVP